MANRYWVGGGSSANWNATGNTNWGTASNTRDNASVPGVSDDVIFDNSANGNSASTISAAANIKSFDASAYTNILTHNASVTVTVIGATIKFGAGMTYIINNAATSAWGGGTVSVTLTSAGKTLGNINYSSAGAGAVLTLADDLTSSGTLSLIGNTTSTKTFNAAGFNVTVAAYATSGTSTKTTTMGAGTWTLTGTGTVWSPASSTDTINANTSTIVINDATATSKTFAGAGKTYNNITFSGDNIIVTGANTFATIANNTLSTNGLILPASTTTTATAFTSTGNSKLVSSSAGTAATLSIASGTVSVTGMSIQDSAATGGATFNCTNGVNVSGNTGWNFLTANARLRSLLGVGL